jgi:hypothetical protein
MQEADGDLWLKSPQAGSQLGEFQKSEIGSQKPENRVGDRGTGLQSSDFRILISDF